MEEIIQENKEESIEEIEKELNAVLDDTTEKSKSGVTVGDVLSRQEFESRFFDLFDIAGDIAEIPELKINRDKNFEVAGAQATAGKLYDCAEKYKLMHFLIENKGGWLGDAILIGGFCYAKANVVVYHYSGRGIGSRIMSRFRRLPASVQQKAGIFSRLFKKEVATNESKETA